MERSPAQSQLTEGLDRASAHKSGESGSKMRAKLLVVEDDKAMADLVVLFLLKEGLSVFSCETAENALVLLKSESFDLLVVDSNLPVMNDFEFLAEVRKLTDCLVLMITARSSDEDLIAGLGLGADEFMTRPFSPQVLVARVRALLRRSFGLTERLSTANIYSFGPYVLDCSTFELRKDDDTVKLSVKEFDVLSYLVSNANIVQTPQAIYDAVWKREYGNLTAVGVYVHRLRKKIEDDPANPVYIKTVPCHGYRFNSGA